MNIKKSLEQATKRLGGKNIKNPHLEAEILFSNILKKPREFILAHPEKQLTNFQISNFKFQISKRLKGLPLAYITGHKESYGFDFLVNKHVLIPRPETELIVDQALNCITRNTKHATIIDVGTGSGCIIITLAKELSSGYPELSSCIRFLATDISKPALALARKNAKLHKVDKKIKFFHGNLLKPIIESKNIKSKIGNRQSAIIVLANLPYLTPTQIRNSPSIQHEPMLALSAGPDGLKYYHQLFIQIKKLAKLTPNSHIFAILEIDPSQVKKIKQLIKNKLPQCKYKIKKDLAGHNRLIILTLK